MTSRIHGAIRNQLYQTRETNESRPHKPVTDEEPSSGPASQTNLTIHLYAPHDEKQVKRAYQIAYCRPAKPGEIGATAEFVKKNGLAAFCRVVFNSTEFIYVN